MNPLFPSSTIKTAISLLLLALSFAAQACTTYEPAPVPVYTNYDRAFDAAVRAAQDSGIRVTSADRTGGLILGSKDGIDVTINVRRQADGTTRVESSFKGQLDRDPTLSRRFDSAYERNMGR
jgi:hypothetical protein